MAKEPVYYGRLDLVDDGGEIGQGRGLAIVFALLAPKNCFSPRTFDEVVVNVMVVCTSRLGARVNGSTPATVVNGFLSCNGCVKYDRSGVVYGLHLASQPRPINGILKPFGTRRVFHITLLHMRRLMFSSLNHERGSMFYIAIESSG